MSSTKGLRQVHLRDQSCTTDIEQLSDYHEEIRDPIPFLSMVN
jgi:hypothetical protein